MLLSYMLSALSRINPYHCRLRRFTVDRSTRATDQGGLQSEIAALRPRDVIAQEAALLDNLEEARPACLGSDPAWRNAREADIARPTLRRKLLHSLGMSRLPWPPDLRPRTVGIIARGLPNREDRLPVVAQAAGSSPPLRPERPDEARAGRVVLPWALVGGQQEQA